MKHIVILSSILASIATSGLSQATKTADDFTSDNAILDTAIPFAIGAREAQQNLRGSFGWSTFQEGQVEGVYFRFDPDGYGRFSKSPRLDSDVFEVVCRPRTYTCMGRKGALSILLTDTGKVQLKVEDVQAGDKLMLLDGVGEIQLPERILAPLEIHFETLLSAGGELLVKRGDADVNRTPLSGFAAATAYLRWVAARQDYTVLPRTWPVPNSKNDDGSSITQALNWDSPMPQPQAIRQVAAGAQYVDPPDPQQFDEVRSEIAELKSLWEQRQNTPSSDMIETQLAQTPDAPELPTHQSELSKLELMTQQLNVKLDELRAVQQNKSDETLISMGDPDLAMTVDAGATPETARDPASFQMVDADIPAEVDHLSYLMKEMGLDAKTAIMFLQMVKSDTPPTDPSITGPDLENATNVEQSYHDSLAESILLELERDLENVAEGFINTDLVLTSENVKKSALEHDANDFDQEMVTTSDFDFTSVDDANITEPDAELDTTDVSQATAPTMENQIQPVAAKLDNKDFQPLTDYFQSLLQVAE